MLQVIFQKWHYEKLVKPLKIYKNLKKAKSAPLQKKSIMSIIMIQIKPKGVLIMELTYTMQGDYLLPDLTLPQEPKIGKYGMLRKTFLKNHKNGIYAGMMISNKLTNHLLEIDKIATHQIDLIMGQMVKAQGVTESLKASDQMKWVGLMNNIKHSAEETVLKELIYN